jgi:hypothetical protein
MGTESLSYTSRSIENILCGLTNRQTPQMTASLALAKTIYKGNPTSGFYQ